MVIEFANMFKSKFTNYSFGIFLVTVLSGLLPVEMRMNTNTINCDKIDSQRHYSLSDMTGTWYGVELLDHVNRGRPTADSCIKIDLKDTGNNQIELKWKERNFEVTYKFVILDPSLRGVWTSQGSQTVTGRLGYEQFAGNVIVLKATDTNVVLTFCSAPHVLYSLVLSKTHMMNETELTSIHNMMQRFRVPTPVDIKKYCKNSSFNTESEALLIVLSIITIFIFSLTASNRMYICPV